ncbi:MAG: flagellar motor protein MotB [Planctomycetota bacterium]
MGKKQKKIPEPPSKAYLVSFGDTMTALLAFFIVINSMAQEQTGANLYSGTGSFVNAVEAIGFSGSAPTTNSKYLTKKAAPMPLYALSENLDKNPIPQEGNLGPDDENDGERKIDRDNENFQRFLHEMNRRNKVTKKESLTGQVAFDSFELFNDDDEEGILSNHALQLGAEIFPVLRDVEREVEVIVWATMPSPVIINKYLKKTNQIKKEIEDKFWIRPADRKRLKFTVKPWLFSDAKRPVLTYIVGQKSGLKPRENEL